MIDYKSHFSIKVSSEKNFGIVFSIFFLLIAIYPIFFFQEIRIWSLVLSILFFLSSFLFPQILIMPNKIWHKFGMMLSIIISPIVMLFIFITTFFPIGIIFKLLGKDLINQRINSKIETYWITRQQKMESMKKQF